MSKKDQKNGQQVATPATPIINKIGVQIIERKDLISLYRDETSKGKISRNYKVKADEKTGQKAEGLFFLIDGKRKFQHLKFIAKVMPILEKVKEIFPTDFENAMQWTANFTQLLCAENESENKYKEHTTIGRKNFGVLDFFPTDFESALQMLEGLRAAVKENRIFNDEISKTAQKQVQNKQIVSAMDTDSLCDALTEEQKQALLAKLLGTQTPE